LAALFSGRAGLLLSVVAALAGAMGPSLIAEAGPIPEDTVIRLAIPCGQTKLLVAAMSSMKRHTIIKLNPAGISGCTYTLKKPYLETKTGLPAVNGELEIIGNGATISRDPYAPEFRILEVTAGGDVTISSTTITGGNAWSFDPGGAILNQGNLTLSDVTLSGNVAQYGGAVNNGGTLLLYHATVTNNGANEGGGVYNTGDLRIEGGMIADNGAARGGGLSNRGAATLYGVLLSENQAYVQWRYGNYGSGAAIDNHGDLRAIYTTIIGGRAAQAGAIYQDGRAWLETVTISNNQSGEQVYDGGAIFARATPETVGNRGTWIYGGSITDNRSLNGLGAGIHNEYVPLTIDGVTIAGNTPDNCYSIPAVAGCVL
jgi:hypothetical protein